MPHKQNIIKVSNNDELLQALQNELSDKDVLDYFAVIKDTDNLITLKIDIDLGGGFESGYELTSLATPLEISDAFRCTIYQQGILEEVGKFFGMQDVTIGYTDFDSKVIVKTNDENRVKAMFADESVRQLFVRLESNFTLQTTTVEDSLILELRIERGISDPAFLIDIYAAFKKVVDALD